MNPTTRHPRRTFLDRLSLGAGAVVLAPLVRSVQAQTAGSTLARKRFLMVTFCNGMNHSTFAPVEFRGRAAFSQELINTTTFTWPEKFAALAKWRDRSLLVDGLVNQQNGGGHLCGYDIACVPKGGTGETGTPGGQTFDQYLAERTGRGTAFPSIALGANTTGGGFNIANTNSRVGIFARGKDQPVTIQMSPLDSYKFLFGGATMGDNPAAALDLKAALARRKTLLDFVGDDVKRLRTALAGAEKQKLDEYVGSLEELQRRVENFATVDTGKCGGPSPGARRFPEEEFVVQADFTAAALACGLTNVATLSFMGLGYGWKKIIPALDVSVHGVGHGAGGAGETQDKFITFVSEQVARIITRLEATREGNGTVMDNTVIMLTSDNAEQHHARGWRWPLLLIGKGGGGLAANGRYLRYPTRSSNMQRVPTGANDNQRALGDLFSALSHVYGQPTDTWGKGGLEKMRGPLAEILG